MTSRGHAHDEARSLLDLPPEIFENVVHKLVSKAGINAAWKLRGVCRTFSSSITFDIFSKLPRSKFRSPTGYRCRGLVTKRSGLYLYYRTKSLLDAHDDLPRKVRQMVQYATEALGMDKPGQKEALLQKVCDNIERVGQSWCIVTALWKGTKFSVLKHMSPDLTARDKVILATLVGSVDILGPLRLDDKIEKHSDLFGSPLRNAAMLGHFEVLKTLLDHKLIDLPTCSRTANERFAPDVLRLFEIAIDNGQSDSVQSLVSWRTQNLPLLGKSVYNEVLTRAIRTGSLRTVEQLFDMPFEGHETASRVTWTHFLTACSHGYHDIVQAFIDRGYLDINDTRPKVPPFIVAVRAGCPRVVQVLLNAGANVDTVWGEGEEEQRALDVAIHKKSLEIVRLLLDAGAVLPNISKWPQHARTYEVLRQAKMKREGVFVPVLKRSPRKSKEMAREP